MKDNKTKLVVYVGILGALSFLLMLFEFPLPLLPPFLKMDVSDLPSIVAAMTVGPVGGFLTQLVKNILKFVIGGTKTGGVGEIANFIIGTLFVVPLGVIYQRKKNLKSYILGATVGSLCMSIVACVINYFVLIPLYATMFGGLETIINMCQAVNKNVSDLGALIILGVLPFNIIKAVCISIAGYFACKLLMPILRNQMKIAM